MCNFNPNGFVLLYKKMKAILRCSLYFVQFGLPISSKPAKNGSFLQKDDKTNKLFAFSQALFGIFGEKNYFQSNLKKLTKLSAEFVHPVCLSQTHSSDFVFKNTQNLLFSFFSSFPFLFIFFFPFRPAQHKPVSVFVVSCRQIAC